MSAPKTCLWALKSSTTVNSDGGKMESRNPCINLAVLGL